MPDLFDMIAQGNADKPCIIQGDRTWSYTEVNERANALARGLLELGVQPDDRTIWVGPNHEQILLWGHATRKAGLTNVPLSYRFTPEEMEYVINDSDSVVVFCDPDYLKTLEGLDTSKVKHIIDYNRAEELIAAHPGEPLDAGGEGFGGSMIYTSGTTGKPKGALRRNIDPQVVASMVSELALSSEDVHITTGPLYHSGPGAFAAVSHILGSTVVVLPRFDPEEWLRLVDEHKVTTTFSAPTQMKRIVNVPEEVRRRYDTSSLRCFIANAAPVPYSLKEQWIEAFGEGHLFEVYGSTELGVDTILRPEDQLRKPGSCGKPYGGIEIKLVREEDEKECEVGEPGVMYIRSPGAFDEYYKAPDKTEEMSLAQDPAWRTVGDIAYRDEEGYFYICDRKSDMIISGGMNIYPAEIEAILHSHPAVMDAGVFGIPSEEWGEQVHAAVQFKEGQSATADELEAFCREHLAGYKVPRSYEFHDELPRTDSGKLLKRKLRDAHWKDQKSRV